MLNKILVHYTEPGHQDRVIELDEAVLGLLNSSFMFQWFKDKVIEHLDAGKNFSHGSVVYAAATPSDISEAARRNKKDGRRDNTKYELMLYTDPKKVLTKSEASLITLLYNCGTSISTILGFEQILASLPGAKDCVRAGADPVQVFKRSVKKLQEIGFLQER